MQVTTVPMSVFAQVASTSATPSTDISVTPTVTPPNLFGQDNGDTNTVVSSTPTTIPVPSLADTPSNSSAVIRQGVSIEKLAKSSYRADEDVAVNVDNANDSEIQATLYNDSGKEVDNAPIEKITDGNQTTVYVHPFHYNFTPGKYRLEVVAYDGSKTEQDFTWGVLALNTNKSVYTPNEQVQFAMAVLDDSGNMVCDAHVSLTVKDPTGAVTTLTTDSGNISVSPTCTSHDVAIPADYSAKYQAGGVGTYALTLSAMTKNGTSNITDSFAVQNSVPFDVERHAPTRIYPPNTYPVSLSVKANQDFSGTVTEFVPASFTITPATGSAQTFDSSQIVSSMPPDLQDDFGVSSLSLAMPFKGSHAVEQGFGVALTDPAEKAYYAANGLSGHDGIDFAMNSGTPVFAADAGTVVLAGDSAYGTTIVIRHSWGQSYYGHLSKLEVAVGQTVKRGEEIALSGATGHVSGPHLHFGIKPKKYDFANGYYGKVDPAPYLPLDQLAAKDKQGVLGASISSINGSVKEINWKVNLKAGDSLTLGYSFKAPNESPQFYQTGPLQFQATDKTLVFQEQRQWQIAADAIQTLYLTTTNGASPYPTTSDVMNTTANASADVTSFAENKKSAGLYQFKPGVNGNTTALGTTASSLPTTPTNSGWIYTGTNLSGQQTASGTWTINYKYQAVYSTAPSIKNLWYRVLGVTCTSGSCSTTDVVSPTDATAPANSGWSKVALGTLPSSGTTSTAQSLTFSASTITWGSSEKPYLEYAIETSSTSSTTGGWKIETNTSSDNIVTTNAALPPPVLNQVHYRWRNDDGSEIAATWRRAEDTAANKSYSSGNIRLRVEISNKTGGSSASASTYQLQYALESTSGAIGSCSSVSSGWAAVPTSGSTDFNMSSSTFVTDATATTAQLTADTTNFVAGQVKTTGNQTSGITLAAATDYTEIEYSIQPTATVGNLNHSFCFRLTNAGSTTNFSYTVWPELTVGQPTVNQEHYRFRNDDGTETSTTGNVLYYNPTAAGYENTTPTFTSCTNAWDCVNDETSNTATDASTPPSSTTDFYTAGGSGSDAFAITSNAIPSGSTVTQLDVFAVAAKSGNPGPTIAVGYCVSCNGTDDTLGSAQSVGSTSFATFTSSFSGLSLTSTQLNGLQILVNASSTKAEVATVYVKVTYNAPGATWKANEDTTLSNQSTSTNVRLRIETANTGGVNGTRNLKLQYATKVTSCSAIADASWSDVPTSAGAAPFAMTTSTYFANGDPTTTQLTATGTFQAGDMVEASSNSSGAFTFTAGNYTENEYALTITTNAASGTTYCFRLNDTSLGALDTYTTYPELSMIVAGPTLDQLMRHGKWFNGGQEQPFTF